MLLFANLSNKKLSIENKYLKLFGGLVYVRQLCINKQGHGKHETTSKEQLAFISDSLASLHRHSLRDCNRDH